MAYAIAFIQTEENLTLGAGLQQFVPQFNQRWEYLTPAVVLIMIPAGLVFFFAQRHLVAGLTAGGTKGWAFGAITRDRSGGRAAIRTTGPTPPR